MNRTRVVFFGIIGVAALIIVAAVALGGGSQGITATSIDSEEGPFQPPAGSVGILVQSSNTKEVWMDMMEEQFNEAGITTSGGQQIVVDVRHTGSTFNPDLQPTIFSPGNMGRVEQTNQDYIELTNRPIISGDCPATVSIPIGIAMWRPMAEALGWPDEPITWGDIGELAANPDGWASVGRPEWGPFRFGHGHPRYSTSGRLSIVAEIHGALQEIDPSRNVTEPLTVDDVWNPAVVEAVQEVQTAVSHYGEIDTALLMRMVNRGTRYLHGVSNYEGNVIQWNLQYGPEGTDQLEFPLVLVYPADGTFWVDQPMCIVDNADWVTEEQIEAAEIFRDYILDREQQALLPQTGIRPAVSGIVLDGPGSLLTSENGVIPTLTQDDIPVLPDPAENVMDNILDMWETVKKPATVVMVVDVSGSMDGEPIRAARESAASFIDRMHPNDEIIVLSFNHEIIPIEPSGLVGEVGETLRDRVAALTSGGGTALYNVTIQAVERIDAMREEDVANGESRIYGIVLLTDGRNEAADNVTESQMFNALPDGTESTQLRVYTIALGDNADTDLMTRIANRTNGKSFTGSSAEIEEIYFEISSEF